MRFLATRNIVIPAQYGTGSDQVPFLRHTTLSAPIRWNPGSQMKFATVPTLWGDLDDVRMSASWIGSMSGQWISDQRKTMKIQPKLEEVRLWWSHKLKLKVGVNEFCHPPIVALIRNGASQAKSVSSANISKCVCDRIWNLLVGNGSVVLPIGLAMV